MEIGITNRSLMPTTRGQRHARMRATASRPTGESVLTERELVQRVRRGSVQALGHLYERHAERVYWTAFRVTGSTAEAEEVLQDVFVGLPEALRRFDERRPLEPWLGRVALRAALNRIRGKERRHRREAAYAARLSSKAGLGSGQRTDARLDLERALKRLPQELRLVLMLKEVEGYSHAEIAELLGIPPGTSASRLSRALERLRTNLGIGVGAGPDAGEP